MDKMLSVHHHKKSNRQPKSKKKPVKVVYISNPMKVKTSVSEFRALVQELTGQDADTPDPSKFSDTESVGGVAGGQEKVSTELKSMDDDHTLEVPPEQTRSEMPKRADFDSHETYDHEDDDDVVFTPRMLESFPGLGASNLWYDSSTHSDEL